MKKLITVVALMSISSLAFAACRSWYIQTADGRTLSCLECCDSSGACNVTCQ